MYFILEIGQRPVISTKSFVSSKANADAKFAPKFLSIYF
ncbi:hypothetical protein CLV60_12533 [Dyadobacter jiangsuensis]|uniref:Uncharacterized protein n=1 Tax=Dyadobacter jiangsuensis TaxID=1591085 RepID=A0A2P8FDR5_9BACT|nr:hypothetical protein CLV60_12533 [Dyadobacter jiangsuensis]